MEELLKHLKSNPQITSVWINEKGEWYFNPMPETKEVSAAQMIEELEMQLNIEKEFSTDSEQALEDAKNELGELRKENAEFAEANEAWASQNEELKGVIAEKDKTISELEAAVSESGKKLSEALAEIEDLKKAAKKK